MKKILLTCIFLTGMVISSCSDDDIKGDTIFTDSETPLYGVDLWLENNIRSVYNIEYIYKWDDGEFDESYNLIPADTVKALQMAKLVKFLLLETWDEEAGVNFTRKYMAKQFQVVGSSAYSSSIRVLGTAEAGIKIVLYNLLNLDPKDVETLNFRYFKTMHHEFTHILDQLKNRPVEFNVVSASDYIGTNWNNYDTAYVRPIGFITPYSSKEPTEDFAETVSTYIVYSDAWWEQAEQQAGAEGWEIIQKKLQIARDYMADYWAVDLDQLRAIARRRSEQMYDMDVDEMYED